MDHLTPACSHFGLYKIIMSSYNLSTTVTQGFLTEYEDKASHTRQHWTLVTVEYTARTRDDRRATSVDVVWRRGYVQFWRAFKCRCWCSSVCMYILVMTSAGCNLIGCFAQSLAPGGKKKLCKKTIPSFFNKKRASYYVADGAWAEGDPSYWTQSPTTFLDTNRVVWKKLCCTGVLCYWE